MGFRCATALLVGFVLTTMSTNPCRRPRVNGDRELEILEATVALVGELGYDRLTFDAVAGRAKVSKATLYKRWPSKAQLVVEAVWSLKSAMTDVDTGTLEGDLYGWAEAFSSYLDHGGIELFLGIVTALRRDEELARVHDAHCMANPQHDISRMFTRAAGRGELPAGVDPQMLAQMVPGMLLLQATAGQLTVPTLPQVRRIVDDLVLPLVRSASPALPAT